MRHRAVLSGAGATGRFVLANSGRRDLRTKIFQDLIWEPQVKGIATSIWESRLVLLVLSRECWSGYEGVLREPYRAGTFEKSPPRPSAIVGCARIASRKPE